MTSETTPAQHGALIVQSPAAVRLNAQNRRLVQSSVPGQPSTARLVIQKGIDAVENHGLEVFVQCLYMVPGVGNALSLRDVAIDLYRICSVQGAATDVSNWMILAIDAIGVVPGGNEVPVPVRTVMKDIAIGFVKGMIPATALDMLWGAAQGNAKDYLTQLDQHMARRKDDIRRWVSQTVQGLRSFIANPPGVLAQQRAIEGKKDQGFWSWLPDGETVMVHAVDELLAVTLPGSDEPVRDVLLGWLAQFERDSNGMLDQAFGAAEQTGTLLAMAAQIARAFEARRHHASHVVERGPGPAHEPDVKGAAHIGHYQTGAQASQLPAACHCLLPSANRISERPIDYATGDENLAQTDFVVDGIVPIVWSRLYRSSLDAYDTSPLGARWSSAFHLSLEVRGDGTLVFFDAENRAVPLPAVAVGEAVDVPTEHFSVARPDAKTIFLGYPDGSRETYVLAGPRYRLQCRLGRDGLGHTLAYNEAGQLVSISDGHDTSIRLTYRNGRVSAIHRIDGQGRNSSLLATYRYDDTGDLLAHHDALDQVRGYDYRDHLLTRYTDFNSYAVHLDWHWPGKPDGLAAPASAQCVRTYIRYPGADRLNSRKILEETRFEYHREHWFTKVTDAAGNVTFYRYDRDNRIVRVERADGTGESYEWDANHNITGIRDAAGRMRRFDYDAQGRIVAETDAVGRKTLTEYDAHGLPVKVTGPAGQTTITAYDPLGRPVSVTDEAGRTTQYAWNDAGRLVSLTDPKGGVRRFSYDAAGRLLQATDCSGYATRYQYDALGHLLRRIDAEDAETAYQHDALGRLVKVTYPDGTAESFQYDGEGNVVAHIDGAMQVTRFAWKMDRHPVSREDAAGHTVMYRYDDQWRLVKLINENGSATSFKYDAIGQLIEQTGFDGKTVRHEYDEAGFRIASREGDVETLFTRDALGRLKERIVRKAGVEHADCHEQFYYDLHGRLTAAQTSGSRVVFHYDDAGNLIAEEQHLRTESAGPYVVVTRHGYDALGNRTRTQLPNTLKIDWLRYGSGHVHGVMVNGEPLLDFERDRLHRETTRTHRAFSARREYDPAGRLLKQIAQLAPSPSPSLSQPQAQSHSQPAATETPTRLSGRRYRYGPQGHLTHIDDDLRGATSYGYDPVGRLLEAVTPDLTETFAYDRAGNRVDPEKVPVRPEVETFAERVARHTREQAQWEAANPGRQYYMGTRPDERANREDALMAEYERRLPKCLDNLLKELEHTRYHYDERGNLIRRIDWGGPTWVYRYDLSNRLVEASRYAKTPEDTTDQHGTDAHHRHRTYIGRTVPELTATYRYDAFGRRTVKEVMQPDGNTDITVFVWDGDVLLIEERFTRTPQKPAWSRPVAPEPALASMVREDPEDAYSLPVAQRAHALDVAWQGVSLYLHEPGTFVPLARLDEKLVEPAYLATGTDGRAVRVPAKTTHTTLFYLNDHLGTPQEIVNDSGKVVWIGRYRAWGAVKKGTKVWQEKPNPGRTVNPIRFQGQYYDEETGLHYNRHRYYDPDAGRFISRDPIGLAGGINVYAYAPNPVTWVDPLGLARSGQWTDVGNGQIRIDPPHVENTNQQVHAHCQCKSRKQEIVVNKDGSQSHGSRGDVSGLTRTEKDYLRDKGFDL